MRNECSVWLANFILIDYNVFHFTGMAGICPRGLDAYRHSSIAEPMICSVEYNNCPYGYLCVHNRKKRRAFCCSKQSNKTTEFVSSTFLTLKIITKYFQWLNFSGQLCQDGSTPLTDPHTKSPTSCDPYLTHCAAGYHCKLNSALARYQCCPDSGCNLPVTLKRLAEL